MASAAENKDQLFGPRLKVARAKKHISDFEADLELYKASKSIVMDFEDDQQSGDRIFFAKVVTPIPDNWPLIIGDAIQNLRSALDHLACLLVLANDPDADISRTFFPITKSPIKYSLDSRKSNVKGMSQSAVDVINNLEPFKGGDDDLWLLRELSNTDKHRMLLIVTAAHSATYMRLFPEVLQGFLNLPNISEFGNADKPEMLEDRAEIWRCKIMYANLVGNPRFAAELVFAESEVAKNKSVVETLHQLLKKVDDIIAAFS